jgi:hypothetical protein
MFGFILLIDFFCLYASGTIAHKLLTFSVLRHNLDWVAQTSIKFKSRLNLKCQQISCTFEVILSVNSVLIDN